MGNPVLDALNEIKRYALMGAKSVLTMEEAALFTGLTKAYLYELTWKKAIPFYKPNGRKIYFDRAELEAWLKQNRVQTQDEADGLAALRDFAAGK